MWRAGMIGIANRTEPDHIDSQNGSVLNACYMKRMRISILERQPFLISSLIYIQVTARDSTRQRLWISPESIPSNASWIPLNRCMMNYAQVYRCVLDSLYSTQRNLHLMI